MKTIFRAFFLQILLLLLVYTGAACQNTDSVAAADPRTRQLKELNNQFKQYQSSNKNSQALEVLQRYGQLNNARLLDNKANEIKKLEDDFNLRSKERKEKLSDIRSATTDLEDEIAALEASQRSLTTRTILFFAVLIGLVILVLVVRNRVLRQVSLRLDTSLSLKKQLEETLKSSNLNDAKRRTQIKEVQNVNQELLRYVSQLERIAEDKNHSESKVVRMLLADLEQSERILSEPDLIQDNETFGKTNLNNLIRDVARLSYEEFCSQNPDFSCELSLDLEAILPEVNVQPVQLRKALFCLFLNALVSVRQKRTEAPKGYQPKITVTTRKLPRFVQIRIRDNGSGIPAYVSPDPESVFAAGNETDQQLALGVQEAQHVVVQMHKGELVFESEPGSQSDAIIRFQIHSLQ
jgi:signal transduction histidine kinase